MGNDFFLALDTTKVVFLEQCVAGLRARRATYLILHLIRILAGVKNLDDINNLLFYSINYFIISFYQVEILLVLVT